MHSTVLGLEAVLPNGDIMDLMNLHRKDNTGFDLKHLFIGSEGTLGVITKVAIATPPKPQSTLVFMAGCNSFNEATEFLRKVKFGFGPILSAFEMIDSGIYDYVSLSIVYIDI